MIFIRRCLFRGGRRGLSSTAGEVADAKLLMTSGEAPSQRLATGMELEFLGTSSACSTLTRNVSSIAFNFGGGTFLFDCGEGTVRQLISSTIKPSQILGVCITHLHGDHFYGLPGLGMRTINLRESKKKIHVFAPKGLRGLFGRGVTHHSQFELTEIYPPGAPNCYPEEGLQKIQWSNRDRSYHIFDHPQFTIKAAPIKHSVFCLGYVIQEKESRGAMLVEKLKQDLNIDPGPIFKDFVRNETVKLPDGRIIKSADYMTPPRKGRKIVILGDTCDPRGIAELAMDADVLVHEATCSDSERTVALEHSHSTAGMAGSFAKSIRAKNLILTHFSPRNFNSNEFEECAHIQTLVHQARKAFGSVNVHAASDFWRFDIPFPT